MKQRISFLFTLILLFYFFTSFSQNAATINGKILNNSFENVNITIAYEANSPIFGTTTIDKEGNFTLTAEIPSHDIYRLNFGNDKYMLFALAPKEKVDITFDANNLQNIISVTGSKSMTFVKGMSDKLAESKNIVDSINSLLQNDPTQKYYNNFFQQFNLYTQTNGDVDNAILNVFHTLDSLKTLKETFFPKGKISGELDLYLAQANTYLKNIQRDYTIFENYQNNVGNYYNFKNNRLSGNSVLQMTDQASFYSNLDQYLQDLEARHDLAKKNLDEPCKLVSSINKERDSLVYNNLLSKKSSKVQFIQKIVNFTDKLSESNIAANNYSGYLQYTETLTSTLLNAAQQNVSNTVKYYQTMYNNSIEGVNKNLRNLIIENKNDITVLMFLDQFPIENNVDLHKEVIAALASNYPEHKLVKERTKVTEAKANSTEIGAMAPELAYANPEGKIMKLSDLKGKVVLIDFWASWCRPCRGENPNVVKLYNKYKNKGFEVFSVSLDSNKDSWIAAIAADKLSWPNHVSDLKKWSSDGARIYGVRSIPCTFLVDREGRIIAKNLRGEQLAKALKDIFGE